MDSSPSPVLKRFLEAQDRLVLQAADLSLGTIANMVERKAIDLNPNYQRRERWSARKQSALIESFLLNVPVPPIYLAEDEFGQYSVVDGKQRITAIHRFMTDKLELTDLEQFVEVEGCRFSNLPRELQNALEVRPYLRVITLLKQSDPLLKFEVFTRLNRGGEQMQAQELRNVAFRGALNDLIYELAENDFLRQQLKIRNNKGRAYELMQDAEFVLRFLTMREVWQNFSGDFRSEMDRFMVRHRDANKAKLAEFRRVFLRAIDGCAKIWGNLAFKRPIGNGWRDQMLAGMYDAEMLAVDLLSDDELAHAIEHRELIVEGTRMLFRDPAFEMAVRQATNTPSRVVFRVGAIRDLLLQV